MSVAAAISALGCGPAQPRSGARPIASASASTGEAEEPPPPIDGAPVLVPQRFMQDRRQMFIPRAKIVVRFGRAIDVIDAETGAVRGVLDRACDSLVYPSADARFFVYPSCEEGRGVEVWDLATDRLRRTAVGLANATIALPPSGRWAVVYDARRGFTLDLRTGEASPLPLPDGMRIARAEIASTGDVLVTDTSESDGPLQRVLFAEGKVRPFELPKAVENVRLFDERALFWGTSWVRLADLRTGAEIAAARPCGEEKVSDASIATSGRFVVTTCRRPSFAVISDDKLSELHQVGRREELDSAPTFDVGPTRLTVSGGESHEVFDLASGALVTRISSASITPLAGQWYWDDADRSLHELRDGRALPMPRENAYETPADSAGRLLLLGGRALDTTSRTWFDADGASPDGGVTATVTPPEADGLRAITVTNRASGVTWTNRAPLGRLHVSPSGTFVAVEGEDDVTVLRDGSSRVLMKNSPSASVAVSGTHVAILLTWFSPFQGGLGVIPPGTPACKGDSCALIQVDDVARGTSRRLDAPSAYAIEFSPRGDRLLVNRAAAWDVKTGRVVWMLETGEEFVGWVQGGLALVNTPPPPGGFAGLRIVDGTTGAEVRRVEGVGRVVATSDPFVVLSAGRRTLLLDARSLGLRELLTAPESAVVVSDDGAFLWFLREGYLVARRLADGRELWWLRDAPPFTDEQVFDPKDADTVPLAVRHGPNVLASPMEKASAMIGTHGHPDLEKDFFAGADVSPKRATSASASASASTSTSTSTSTSASPPAR
ncbi:MAG: hypothetical protein U0414_42005 [Polyangiaceae bacterium]